MNRYNCHTHGEKKLLEFNKIYRELDQGHLYYNAVPCAEKTLGGEYLRVAFVVLISFVALILF
jgi:hypothetical protein